MRLRICKYFLLVILFGLLVSCNSYKQNKAEKAINDFAQRNFLQPASFHAKRFYKPLRVHFTEEDAKTANEFTPGRNAKPFDGWMVAVDIEALTSYGNKGEQSATFQLNLSCDSVTSADVAPMFLKK